MFASRPPTSANSPILATPAAQDTAPLPTKHSRFYFEDSMVTFEIQNRLFRVHRHFLARESEVFRNLFSPAYNKLDERIVLSEVTVDEFEALLVFYYDGMHGLPVDIKFWIDLLSISTHFAIGSVRKRAIRQLTYATIVSSVEKIYLAKKYDIPQWLYEEYQRLCRRSEPLELWEAERIGWDTAVLIAKAREVLRDSREEFKPPEPEPPRSPSPVPPTILDSRPPSPSFDDWRVSQAVARVFDDL